MAIRLSELGGALQCIRAIATITDCTISGNTAIGEGGGIGGGGTLNITNSTLSGNISYNRGGAIYCYGTSTIADSTIALQFSDSYGGGIADYGTLQLSNSSVSGNSAPKGGRLYNEGASTLTITDTTISGNSSGSSSGDDGGVTIQPWNSLSYGFDTKRK